jgi:hypothetical protein
MSVSFRRADEPDQPIFIDDAPQQPMLGAVSTLNERSKPRRKKLYKRPIGFLADIDKLEPADD